MSELGYVGKEGDGVLGGLRDGRKGTTGRRELRVVDGEKDGGNSHS